MLVLVLVLLLNCTRGGAVPNSPLVDFVGCEQVVPEVVAAGSTHKRRQ
jgi:hypothetical protein